MHPFRRWADFNICAYPGCISGAQIPILYFHRNVIFHLFPVFLYYDLWRMERLPEGSRRFPGNSQYAIAIHTIGGYFIFKYRIPKPQCFHRIAAHLGIFSENINPVLRRLRIHFPGSSQLFDGTHHPTRRHAAQLPRLNSNPFFRQRPSVMPSGHFAAVQHHRNFIPFLHIRGTGYYLNHLSAHIHLAHNQLIRIGMLLDFFYLPYYYLFQILIQSFIAFHLCS